MSKRTDSRYVFFNNTKLFDNIFHNRFYLNCRIPLTVSAKRKGIAVIFSVDHPDRDSAPPLTYFDAVVLDAVYTALIGQSDSLPVCLSLYDIVAAMDGKDNVRSISRRFRESISESLERLTSYTLAFDCESEYRSRHIGDPGWYPESPLLPAQLNRHPYKDPRDTSTYTAVGEVVVTSPIPLYQYAQRIGQMVAAERSLIRGEGMVPLRSGRPDAPKKGTANTIDFIMLRRYIIRRIEALRHTDLIRMPKTNLRVISLYRAEKNAAHHRTQAGLLPDLGYDYPTLNADMSVDERRSLLTKWNHTLQKFRLSAVHLLDYYVREGYIAGYRLIAADGGDAGGDGKPPEETDSPIDRKAQKLPRFMKIELIV